MWIIIIICVQPQVSIFLHCHAILIQSNTTLLGGSEWPCRLGLSFLTVKSSMSMLCTSLMLDLTSSLAKEDAVGQVCAWSGWFWQRTTKKWAFQEDLVHLPIFNEIHPCIAPIECSIYIALYFGRMTRTSLVENKLGTFLWDKEKCMNHETMSAPNDDERCPMYSKYQVLYY